MGANEFRRDCQTKSYPSCPRGTLESLEQMGPRFFGHTRTRVGHFYHRDAAFTSAGYTNLIPARDRAHRASRVPVPHYAPY